MLSQWSTFEKIQQDAAVVFNHRLSSLEELSFEKIQNLITAISSNALTGFLEGFRGILLQLLDLFKDIIGVVRGAILTKIRFPFIEKLVKLVAPYSKPIDTSFNVVGVLMLIIAIPTTATYKSIYGDLPLKKNMTIPLPFNSSTITI